MKRIFYIIIGTISLVLGGIGIFFPILPTTPFLLLAAWLYLRSSERLYNWLINHRVFGLYIRSYIKYKGVSKKYKIAIISLLWATMFISMSIVNVLHVRIILGVIGLGVTTHILMLRTLTKEEMIELEKFETEEKKKMKKQVTLQNIQ